MKITTREVLQWDKSTNQYVLIEEDSYEYDGLVAEMKGGSAPPSETTTTTTSKPFNEQLPFVTEIFNEAQDLFQSGPPEFFPGQTVAPFSPETQAALSLQTQLAGDFGQFLDPQLNALTGLLATPDPANDPTVQAFVEASLQPIEQQFLETTLPAIESAAISQGAFGGSRQDIVEAQALRDFTQTAANVSADIYKSAFDQQLEAQQRALALAPTIGTQLAIPSQLLSEVGATRENFEQALLNTERERFEFEQLAPLIALQEYSNLINQFGGSSATALTSTTGGAPVRSPLTGALGGAATGAQIGSLIPGVGTTVGAIGGGLIGLF